MDWATTFHYIVFTSIVLSTFFENDEQDNKEKITKEKLKKIQERNDFDDIEYRKYNVYKDYF